MRYSGFLLAAAAALYGIGAGAASNDLTPMQWLEWMSLSHREVNFRGVVTYRTEGRSSAFKVTHGTSEGREYEYLEPLDENGRELVRRGHNLQCIHPADQIIRPGSDSKRGSFQQFYRLSLEGGRRVAHRDGVLLAVRAADSHRLSYRMVLDAETALPLQVDVVDGSGKVLERFEYAMVQFNTGAPKPPGEGAVEVSHAEPLQVAANESTLRDRPWQPEWVPPGFLLAQAGQEGGANAISYTDGLAMFSVFLDKDTAATLPAEAVVRRGATVAYSRRLSKRTTVTVVGEIPVATAKAVAKSVSWKP